MMASSVSDLKRRESLAWTAFWKLQRMWRNPNIPISTKVRLFDTTWFTILLHGCESRVISKAMEDKINAFGILCYRIMLNIKRIDRVTNVSIYNLTKARQLKLLGHFLGLHVEELCREYALYIPKHAKRKTGRQRTLFLKYTQSVPKVHSMSTKGSEWHARPMTAVSYHGPGPLQLEKDCSRLLYSRAMVMMMMVNRKKKETIYNRLRPSLVQGRMEGLEEFLF